MQKGFIAILLPLIIFIVGLFILAGYKYLSTQNSLISPESSYKKIGVINPKEAENPVLGYQNSTKNLSIDNMFNYVDPAVASAKNNNPGEYTIIATGDVIPARSVNARLVQLNDFSYPFKKTVNFLKTADAVFVNLESPLIPNCQVTNEGMKFCGDQRDINGLVYAGVGIANIANNHMGNYGIEGIDNTTNLLKKNNIAVTGNNQPAIILIRDKKFGFLGYNNIGGKEPGIAWADIPQIEQDIKNLKKEVDFIIVTFHWGTEYTSTPDKSQVQLAHLAIDAGADLIIGNHPHWVQGVEEYKGKIITYAHGNFIFDQMWSEETREGVLGKYIFNNKGLADVKFIPIIIDNYSEARFANATEATKILSRMHQSSQQIILMADN